jgi:hypothetical protein
MSNLPSKFGQEAEDKRRRDASLKTSKSRVHWSMDSCVKFDCSNRGKKCGDCIRFSEYAD